MVGKAFGTVCGGIGLAKRPGRPWSLTGSSELCGFSSETPVRNQHAAAGACAAGEFSPMEFGKLTPTQVGLSSLRRVMQHTSRLLAKARFCCPVHAQKSLATPGSAERVAPGGLQ